MRTIILALKDLLQIIREKESFLFLVLMPVVFTLFMGFAYRGGSSSKDQRIPLGWVNHDPQGTVSQSLQAMLLDSQTVRLQEIQPEEMQRLLRNHKIAGVLEVPPAFSKNVFAGEAPQLNLMVNSGSADGQQLFELLRRPVTQLLSASQIAFLTVDSVQTTDAITEQQVTFQTALASWKEVSETEQVEMVQATVAEAESWYGDNPYNQSSPGILIQFTIFSLVASGQIVLQERKTRTLQRLITISMKPREIIAGHLLAIFILVLLQALMLIIFGQLVLKVNYLRQPAGTLLMTLGLCAWVASLGLLIGIAANSEDKVVLFSLIAMFVLSSLGGAWFPLEGTGGAFAFIGKLTPSAWAMTGLQNLLIRGLGFSSTLLPALVQGVYALLFFILAVWRFRKMEF